MAAAHGVSQAVREAGKPTSKEYGSLLDIANAIAAEMVGGRERKR